MLKKLHRPRAAWLPILAGLTWLWFVYGFSPIGFLVAIIPGGMLFSSGVSMLLYPGDYRIPRFIGLGGVLGIVLALPVLFVASVWLGVVLILLSAACFVGAGFVALGQEFFAGDIPPFRHTPRLAAEAALDDAFLAGASIVMPAFVDYDPPTVHREVETALELFEDRGWLRNPASFHLLPPPLEAPAIESRRGGKLPYEHLSFDSGYEPDAAAPGRDYLYLDSARFEKA